MSKRDDFLKNKVRFRHRHESLDELKDNVDIHHFRFSMEDNVEILKELEENFDNLNKKQLIVIEELQWEISALFSEAKELINEYEDD